MYTKRKAHVSALMPLILNFLTLQKGWFWIRMDISMSLLIRTGVPHQYRLHRYVLVFSISIHDTQSNRTNEANTLLSDGVHCVRF